MRISEISVKDLKTQLNLPKNTDPRLMQRIVDLIDQARGGEEGTPYVRVANSLKQLGEVDRDVKKFYKVMAKLMIGNDISSKERQKIIKGISDNKLIDISELKSVSSDMSKIIPMYNDSTQVKSYFKDMLMYQPGQRIGPGEILFATHHKDLSKPPKGDLRILSTQEDIEVKGGIGAGRFSDDDVMPGPEFGSAVDAFLQKYKGTIQTGKSGISIQKAVEAGKQITDPAQQKALYDDIYNVMTKIFTNGGYEQKLRQAINSGNGERVVDIHGLRNLQQYFAAKPKEGVLFLRANLDPAPTSYANTLDELLQVANITVKQAYLGRIKEAFPQISATPKQ